MISSVWIRLPGRSIDREMECIGDKARASYGREVGREKEESKPRALIGNGQGGGVSQIRVTSPKPTHTVSRGVCGQLCT